VEFIGKIAEVLCFEERIAGYIIHSDFEVYEIAIDPCYKYIDFLSALDKKNIIKNYSFLLPRLHPLEAELISEDFTISHRQCAFGGHMIRIVNTEYLINNLNRRFLDFINKFNISDFSMDTNYIVAKMSNNKCIIKIKVALDGYIAACLLLGADSPSFEGNYYQAIFDLKPYNILLADQC
jgi:hypothetical protein